jgi:nucleotidyltransferase substrate binding protein (TIGR01987 family)
MKRLEQVREDFEKALKALEESVVEAESDLEIDGLIQRFEFTFELVWKLLKLYLEREGIIVKTPRECFKEAFRLGLLLNEEQGLKMIDDGNRSIHLYDRVASREVSRRIKLHYVKIYREILARINESVSR